MAIKKVKLPNNTTQDINDARVVSDGIAYKGDELGEATYEAEGVVVDLSDYQRKLESGVNIKTVNNQSLLGSGNMTIATGESNVIESVSFNGTTAPVTNKNAAITADVVSAIGTSGNSLTYTKNGTTSNITVPYATKAGQDDAGHRLDYYYHKDGSVFSPTINGFPKLYSSQTNNAFYALHRRKTITYTGFNDFNAASLFDNDGNTIGSYIPAGGTGVITIGSTSDEPFTVYTYGYIYLRFYVESTKGNASAVSIRAYGTKSGVEGWYDYTVNSLIDVEGYPSGFMWRGSNQSIYFIKAWEITITAHATLPTYLSEIVSIFTRSNGEVDQSAVTKFANAQTLYGAITVDNTFTANSIVKSGGTSSQFLKADGSVDSNTYLTTTGTAVRTTAINITTDDRSTAVPNPNAFLPNSVTAFFKSTMPGDVGVTKNNGWNSGVTVFGWSNNYVNWQLYGPANSGVANTDALYWREGAGTTWQSARKIWDSGNLDPSAYIDQYHLYHKLKNNEQYFDSYGGENLFRIITENFLADTLRYKSSTISNIEYWDYTNSAWATWETNMLYNLFDGDYISQCPVPYEQRKFRFEITTSSSWPTTTLLVLAGSWYSSGTVSPIDGDTYIKIKIETRANTSAEFVTKKDIEFKHNCMGTNAMVLPSAVLHTGEALYRITIELAPWSTTANSASLRQLCIFSNYGGNSLLSFKSDGFGNVSPRLSNTYSLGTSGSRWSTIYGTNLNLNGTATGITALTTSGDVTCGGELLIKPTDKARLRLVGYNSTYTYIQAGNASTNNGHLILSGYNGTYGSTIDINFDTIALGGNVSIGTSSSPRWLTTYGTITGNSFVKSGGTSSQFLKADGSSDSTVYASKSYVDDMLGDIESLINAL